MRARLVSMLMAWVPMAGVAYAQGAPRFDVGPIVRADHVRVEGDLTGVMPVAGLAASLRIRNSMALETEVTWATGTLRRHYTGWFVSFAPPGASLEEIERLSPIARRDLSYTPGWGGTAALVWRGAVSPRMDLGFRFGLSGRAYVEESTFTMITVPPGVDPARLAQAFVNTRGTYSRGGVLIGVDAPVRLTPRFRVIPEVRYVHGPRQVGNAHREWGVSVRGMWGL